MRSIESRLAGTISSSSTARPKVLSRKPMISRTPVESTTPRSSSEAASVRRAASETKKLRVTNSRTRVTVSIGRLPQLVLLDLAAAGPRQVGHEHHFLGHHERFQALPARELDLLLGQPRPRREDQERLHRL